MESGPLSFPSSSSTALPRTPCLFSRPVTRSRPARSSPLSSPDAPGACPTLSRSGEDVRRPAWYSVLAARMLGGVAWDGGGCGFGVLSAISKASLPALSPYAGSMRRINFAQGMNPAVPPQSCTLPPSAFHRGKSGAPSRALSVTCIWCQPHYILSLNDGACPRCILLYHVCLSRSVCFSAYLDSPRHRRERRPYHPPSNPSPTSYSRKSVQMMIRWMIHATIFEIRHRRLTVQAAA